MKSLSILVLLGSVVGILSQCNNLPNGDSCEGQDKSQFPDPEDCSSYYICEAGCAKHLKCERNFLFDTLHSYCTYPLDVECEGRPCSDPTHCLTTTPMPTTTPDCGHVADCKDFGNGGEEAYYADPYNCRKYWHCYAGRSEHVMCDDGLMFDEDNIWCDYSDRVDCGSRPVCDDCDNNCVSPSPRPSTTPDCGHLLDCTDLEDGWYEDQYNCRKYWHCTKGKGVHYTCENNLFYDQTNNWCDYPDRVECGSRPVCGACDDDCVTVTQPTECGHVLDCTGKVDGYHPDPYNCRKYWHCDHGHGVHYMCENSLVFDIYNVWCDYQDRVNCGGRPVCDDCDKNCH